MVLNRMAKGEVDSESHLLAALIQCEYFPCDYDVKASLTCRAAAGVKEIDIAATLEHVRDQRPGMVRTKVSSCEII